MRGLNVCVLQNILYLTSLFSKSNLFTFSGKQGNIGNIGLVLASFCLFEIV